MAGASLIRTGIKVAQDHEAFHRSVGPVCCEFHFPQSPSFDHAARPVTPITRRRPLQALKFQHFLQI